MSEIELVIAAPHEQQLRDVLFPTSGHEAGAFLLLGKSNIERCPWEGCSRQRYMSHEVIAVPDEDIVTTSPHHFSWRKKQFLAAYRIARENGLAIAFAHSHRTAPAYFSRDDDQNDIDVLELISHRSGSRPDYLSIVVDEQDGVVARVASASGMEEARVTVLGERGWRFAAHESDEWSAETHSRQLLAFDDASQHSLRSMRIGVVGAGATGSATLQLLMRLGVGRIAVIDPDVVEISNVSRVHGSSVDDAERRRSKVDVARRCLESSGLETHVVTHQGTVGELSIRDTLRSCHVLFGCTDDHAGRLFLNRFALYYHTPLIDMGIKIDPVQTRSRRMRLADGRVTVVGAGSRCLACRGIASPKLAAEESLQRSDPEEYGRRIAEGYMVGGGVQNPAVVTFTTEVACKAVDELLARLTEYRTPCDSYLRQFALMADRTPGVIAGTECGVCDRQHWGRGDVTPFLDRVEAVA